MCGGGKYETLLATSLLKGIQELYPDKKIFFITHPINFQILNGNNYIYKKMNFFEGCEDPALMEGNSKETGFFDVCYILPKIKELKNLHPLNRDKVNISINEPNN